MTDLTLADQISSATDEQAARAVLLFFESTPDQYWEEGRPSLEGSVGMLVEKAKGVII
jgi:hypothetical protein